MTDEVQTAEAVEADLSAGFAKVSGEPKAAEPAVPVAAEPAAPAVPVKDEWEGVQPMVRKTLETITSQMGKIGTIEQRLKTTEGRVGAIQAAQATAGKVAQAGGSAPTAQQIQQASTSGEKWKALLEAFPDFTDGLEEQRLANEKRFADLDAAMKKQQPFDQDGFRKTVVDDLTAFAASSAREAREFAKLDRKHESWEDTINTPQFAEWTYAGGPTPQEQAQYAQLKGTSPDQAEAFFAAFEAKFPQWWAEKGSLMASSNAKDAIALLDSYEQHTKQASAKAAKKTQSAQRLEAAVTPQGASAPQGKPQDEEADFNRGFKKVAKK